MEWFLLKIVQNVVKKTFIFSFRLPDGSRPKAKVEAESEAAARLLLGSVAPDLENPDAATLIAIQENE